jgi:hypothetical protein
MTDHPHVPAAFINAIAEEGTKAEAITWLQKQWNETCALRKALRELMKYVEYDQDYPKGRYIPMSAIDQARSALKD